MLCYASQTADGMGWDGMRWGGMGWGGVGLGGVGWDGMGWDGMEWDGMGWSGRPMSDSEDARDTFPPVESVVDCRSRCNIES